MGAFVVHFGTDNGVRTDEHTLTALNADVRLPDRHFQSDIALLPPCCAAGIGPIIRQGAHGQQVAFARDHFADHLLYKFRHFRRHG